MHAVDFSPVALERARKLADAAGLPVAWERADLREWVPPEEAYDLVLISYLHLPWPTMRDVLHRAARAVAPGGLFLLVGHDRTNLDRGVGGPPDPGVLYGPEQVAAELAGFEIEKAARVQRPVQTDRGPREAIDCLVRAIRRCDV